MTCVAAATVAAAYSHPFAQAPAARPQPPTVARPAMAPSSVRDITVKDDDFVAATHGRGFWILDNLTPLRQLELKVIDADAHMQLKQAGVSSGTGQ